MGSEFTAAVIRDIAPGDYTVWWMGSDLNRPVVQCHDITGRFLRTRSQRDIVAAH